MSGKTSAMRALQLAMGETSRRMDSERDSERDGERDSEKKAKATAKTTAKTTAKAKGDLCGDTTDTIMDTLDNGMDTGMDTIMDTGDRDQRFRPVLLDVIHPKALSSKHLFGHVNPKTQEWTDGILALTLRHAAGQYV